MATYGDFPGVQVTTAGGGIAGIQIGAEEKLVFFGKAELGGTNGSASVNDPTQILARSEADTKFGEDSELSTAMKLALNNGANIDFMYGVAVEEVSVSSESVSSNTGTLAETPLVEEASTISADVTVSDVVFKYESAPTDPGNQDNVLYVNPFTGEYVYDSSNTVSTISYDHFDYESAFNAADTVVNEDETGIYVALSEAEDVASQLAGKVTALREEYQLVSGLAGAEPNQTGSDDDPEIDAGNYTDAVDNDAQFLFGPVRFDTTKDTALGPIGGLFSGAAITEPIYNDNINTGGRSLEQKLTRSDAQSLRDVQVIPVRQAGAIRVVDNLSTSTEQDWQRDFWRRRIVDRVVLIAKEVGDATIGRINDERTRNAAERTIRTELQALANDRLIEPNTDDETNFFVDVYQDDTNADEANIDIGITPQGIVKRIDASITINT